ncbi:MAG: methyltransferase [Fusobacteria bacterium]|nr:methyltransferase [Fusobacteriota bacterium]
MKKQSNLYTCEVKEDLDSLYFIIQKKIFGRFSEDPINLVKFAKSFIKQEGTILDIGTGTGIIPLAICVNLLSYKNIIAIEKNYIMSEMAKRTFEIQNIMNITIINQDIMYYNPEQKFDVVFCNPPYFKTNYGKLPKNSIKKMARFECDITLEKIIFKVKHILNHEGLFFMCHLESRKDEISRLLVKYSLRCDMYFKINSESTLIFFKISHQL